MSQPTDFVTKPLILKQFKRAKYGNKKVEYKGMKFDSILERDRWVFLETMQAEGRITDLERQVKYPLEVNGKLICSMILDYRYYVPGVGTITSDAKGRVTADWAIKAKLFEAIYRKSIRIVTRESLTTL